MKRYLMRPDKVIEITPDIDRIHVRADGDKIHYLLIKVNKIGGYEIKREYRTKETVGFVLKGRNK